MTDLRDRIAAAACGATSFGKSFPWDTLSEAEKNSWRSVADAVIAELNLRSEKGQRSNATGPLWGGDNRHIVTRYVTDWEVCGVLEQ